TGVGQANRFAVFHNVGNDEDFRVVGQQELAQNVDLQFAEPAAEGNVLLRCQLLITEYQDAIIEMGLMHTGKISRIERSGKINADNLGSDHGIKGTYFKCLRGNICSG